MVTTEETPKKKPTMWIVLVGIIALLFGCLLGAIGGGAAGFFAGRAAARHESSQNMVPSFRIYGETPQQDQQDNVLPWRTGGSGTAALVMEVVADSPAEQAGLQVGDRITAVDDQTIDADHALADVIAGYTPGQQVTLTVIRDSETLTVKLTLGENPDQAGQPWVGISYRMMPAIETSPNGSGG